MLDFSRPFYQLLNGMATYSPLQIHTKHISPVVVRSAVESDAKDILHVAKSVIAEEIYQLMTTDEFRLTQDDEKTWIKSFIDKPLGLLLVAETDDKIVGLLDFHIGHRKRISHVGDFAISVLKDYRGLGIGYNLIKTMIDWARSTKVIEKINLQVHSTNHYAIQTYLKNGFVIEGVRKKELKYGPDHYVDAVLMARFIND